LFSRPLWLNLCPLSTRLLLIRHGATILTAEDRFAGSTEVELSNEGREQASRLGERISSLPIAAVYASPLGRTLETARFVAAPRELSVIERAGLREIDHGHWEGLRRSDVEQSFADEYAAWEEDPFTFAPSGGESGVSVMARALPAIREIVTSHTGQTVAVVSHKATIRLILCGLLGVDARGYRDRFDQAPACLNVLEFKDPVRVRLMLYNDTSHYSSEARRPSQTLSSWWG
jgi:probable phosphoglycerate mutase